MDTLCNKEVEECCERTSDMPRIQIFELYPRTMRPGYLVFTYGLPSYRGDRQHEPVSLCRGEQLLGFISVRHFVNDSALSDSALFFDSRRIYFNASENKVSSCSLHMFVYVGI